MSHLQKALDHLDVLEAHLRAAEDEPEMPVQLLHFLRASLHDIERIIHHHAQILERDRRRPGHPNTGGNP